MKKSLITLLNVGRAWGIQSWWFHSVVAKKYHLAWFAETAFPYVYVMSWFFLLLDFYLYPGFSRKLIFIDPRLLIGLTLALGVLALLLRPVKETSFLLTIVLGINRLIAPVVIFLYFLLTITESSTFSNFIFSHYHVHALFSKYFVVLIVSVLLVDVGRAYQATLRSLLLPTQKIRAQLSHGQYYLILAVIGLVGYTLMQNVFTTWHTLLQYYPYMIQHPFASIEEKREYILGDYAFFRFLRDYTPPDAVIAIPPQQTPWLTSGNGGYVRYFLYPRKVPNSTLTPPFPPEATYAMVAKGEWTVEDESKYGWPRATVSAEKIWYFDRATGVVTETDEHVFDPSQDAQRYRWGLLKLKRN